MTVYFHDITEWYPIILLVSEREDSYDGKTAEFTADEVARIEAAFEEFDAVQRLMNMRFGYTD